MACDQKLTRVASLLYALALVGCCTSRREGVALHSTFTGDNSAEPALIRRLVGEGELVEGFTWLRDDRLLLALPAEDARERSLAVVQLGDISRTVIYAMPSTIVGDLGALDSTEDGATLVVVGGAPTTGSRAVMLARRA